MSGLGALQRSLCRRSALSGNLSDVSPALFVSGPGALCQGPALSVRASTLILLNALCVGPRRSLRRSSALSGALCVGARRSSPNAFVSGPDGLCVGLYVGGPALFAPGLALFAPGPGAFVSGPGALCRAPAAGSHCRSPHNGRPCHPVVKRSACLLSRTQASTPRRVSPCNPVRGEGSALGALHDCSGEPAAAPGGGPQRLRGQPRRLRPAARAGVALRRRRRRASHVAVREVCATGGRHAVKRTWQTGARRTGGLAAGGGGAGYLH